LRNTARSRRRTKPSSAGNSVRQACWKVVEPPRSTGFSSAMIRPRLSPRVRPSAPVPVLHRPQALLAHPTPSRFEAVAEELKPWPLCPAVPDRGSCPGVGSGRWPDPRLDLVQGRLRRCAARTQDHGSRRRSAPADSRCAMTTSSGCRYRVRQQRADDRPLRGCRPSAVQRPQTLDDVLAQPLRQQRQQPTIAEPFFDACLQSVPRNCCRSSS